MKNIGVFFIISGIASSAMAQFQNATAPVAQKKEHWRNIHGDNVLDNYYWLYDYFGKGPDSAKVIDYLKAENEYFDAVMRDTIPLQEKLFVEMKSRIKEKDESV